MNLNPKTKYIVSIFDFRTGQVVFSRFASNVKEITEMIQPTFQQLGYSPISESTVRKVMSNQAYRNKNGFSVSDVLKITRFVMTCSQPMNVIPAGPMTVSL